MNQGVPLYGESGQKLKPLAELLLPDPRFKVHTRFEGGVFRKYTLDDHYKYVSEYTVSSNVPEDVRIQFEAARNVLVYSWFVYEFLRVAQLQAYAALELAIKTRFPIEGKERRTLGKLLETVAKAGILKGKDFACFRQIEEKHRRMTRYCVEMEEAVKENASFIEPVSDETLERAIKEKYPPPDPAAWLADLFGNMPDTRNHLAHGGMSLSFFSAFFKIEICADFINALYR